MGVKTKGGGPGDEERRGREKKRSAECAEELKSARYIFQRKI